MTAPLVTWLRALFGASHRTFLTGGAHSVVEAGNNYEHSPQRHQADGVFCQQKESVMIKLGKVSVETRGSKAIYPQEIANVLYTYI